MKRLLQIILLTLLISCNDKPKSDIPKLDYFIINEVKDRTFNKTSVEIRLQKKITETELKTIALEIKNNRKDYDKVWIFYFLPGQEPGNGAWAITHFKPELNIEIIGATIEAATEIKTTKVTGEILNTWFESDAMLSNTKYLVKENDKLFIKSIYPKSKLAGDGGEIKEEVFEKKLKGGIMRYDYENIHGEYYLIEKNGNLGMYDDSVKFKEVKKTDIAE